MPGEKFILALTLIAVLLIGLGIWFLLRNKPAPKTVTQKPAEPQRSPEGYLLLAGDALRNKQLGKARDFASTGLRMNPKDKRTRSSLLNILGNIVAESGSRETAFKYFMEASKTDPTFAFPHNNLGNLYFMEKDFAGARKEYEEALRLKPDYADAKSNLTRLKKILNR